MRHFLFLFIVGSMAINHMNATVTGRSYPRITPYRDPLPINGKMVTLVTDGGTIKNVPLALLADQNISETFATMLDSVDNHDSVTEIPVTQIDDGTLCSIIYFMITAQMADQETSIGFFNLYLKDQEQDLIWHYYNTADYLQFDWLKQAAGQLLSQAIQ